MTSPRVAAVVAAAGRGRRLGDEGPKSLALVGGVSLVAHALDRLVAAGIPEVVVVYTDGHRGAFEQACAGHPDAVLVPGGATRTDSVHAGVGALTGGARVVAVHDAARGLCPPEIIRATVDALRGDTIAVAPALPVADTLKRVVDGRVVATVERRDLVGVQTPQVVRRDVLESVMDTRAGGSGDPTDELGLVEEALAAGQVSGEARVVEGDVRARKVTWPGDIGVAEAMLEAEGPTP